MWINVWIINMNIIKFTEMLCFFSSFCCFVCWRCVPQFHAYINRAYVKVSGKYSTKTLHSVYVCCWFFLHIWSHFKMNEIEYKNNKKMVANTWQMVGGWLLTCGCWWEKKEYHQHQQQQWQNSLWQKKHSIILKWRETKRHNRKIGMRNLIYISTTHILLNFFFSCRNARSFICNCYFRYCQR